MKTNDFDSIAFLYDWLKRIVFWGNIDRATNEYLGQIQSYSNILIVGGGTGKLLNYLPDSCKVTYVEKSEKMLLQAYKYAKARQIKFVNLDFLEFSSEEEFDALICPFFLDVFGETNLNKVIQKFSSMMHSKSLFLVSDFQPVSHTAGRGLIKIMLWFFDITTKLEARKLLSIHQFLHKHGFSTLAIKAFHFKMIFAAIYQREEM